MRCIALLTFWSCDLTTLWLNHHSRKSEKSGDSDFEEDELGCQSNGVRHSGDASISTMSCFKGSSRIFLDNVSTDIFIFL